MAMTRRDPESRWLEPFGRDWFADWPFRPLFRRMIEDNDLKVEEFAEGREVVIRAELPGVDPDRDIDINVVNGNLVIRAERRHEETQEGRDYRRSEIRYGAFSRTLPLPPAAKVEDIKATYHDGILEVRAPIQDSASTTSKVPITKD
jgi:HSP20 family protein